MPDESVTPIDTELLDRFLARRCTDDERARVEIWLSESSVRKAAVASLTEWASTNGYNNTDVDAALQRVKRAALDPRAAVAARRLLERGSIRGRQTWWRPIHGLIGAASALVIVVLAVVLFRADSSSDTRIAQTYATHAGQQARITLADGTRITLAPNTILHTVHSSATSRTVLLPEGEAYFEVAHVAGASFVVKSGHFTTQVLGTTFLVQHVANAPGVRVAVSDGKVRVTSPLRDPVTLTAGTVGEMHDSVAQVNAIDKVAPGVVWSHGKLGFHDTPVGTVLRTLGRWYGYEFRCSDSTFVRQNVNIIVSMQSSSAALATLEEILGVNLNVVGDTVTLIPQAHSPAQRAPRVKSYDTWTPSREVGR